MGASGSGSNSPSVTETGDIAKQLKTKDELLNVVKVCNFLGFFVSLFVYGEGFFNYQIKKDDNGQRKVVNTNKKIRRNMMTFSRKPKCWSNIMLAEFRCFWAFETIQRILLCDYSLMHLILSQSLHAVEVSTIINFLPSLLTQLFRLLTRTAHEDVAVNAAK